jgi:hypothetical protein
LQKNRLYSVIGSFPFKNDGNVCKFPLLLSMKQPSISDVEYLVKEQALPSDHGARKFLTLIKHSPSAAIPFLTNIGLGLLSRTENPSVDLQKSTQSLNTVFRGLDVQTNRNATQVIAHMTRHCLNLQLQPQDILYAAQGAARAEVLAIFRLEQISVEAPAPQKPSPSSGIALGPKGHGPSPSTVPHTPSNSPYLPNRPGSSKKP